MERPFVQLRRAGHAPRLLVVAGKMLDAGADAPGLERLYKRCAHLARQAWILGIVFKIAAAERTAFDVQAGSEQHGHALGLTFLSQRLAQPLHDTAVKGGSQSRRCGIADRLDARPGPQMVPLPHLLAQTVGTVAHHHPGHAQTLHRLGVPEIPSGTERGLFLQSQRLQNRFCVHRSLFPLRSGALRA